MASMSPSVQVQVWPPRVVVAVVGSGGVVDCVVGDHAVAVAIAQCPMCALASPACCGLAMRQVLSESLVSKLQVSVQGNP